ncbi:hypothetical protein EYF80_049070 [Liparis tanakae]|uniref:Uncharacterized protein n=1 Tax=Liparis tanakae TaxID=230148 RepID=A0A4Z2FIH7_9TELE|nr:hypothetical protein EYF80_049070 [Liparis tanakae]
MPAWRFGPGTRAAPALLPIWGESLLTSQCTGAILRVEMPVAKWLFAGSFHPLVAEIDWKHPAHTKKKQQRCRLRWRVACVKLCGEKCHLMKPYLSLFAGRFYTEREKEVPINRT